MTDTLNVITEAQRYLDTRYDLAELSPLTDVGPATHFLRYLPTNPNSNIAGRYPGMAVIKVGLIWNNNADAAARFEAQFDSAEVPRVDLEGLQRLYLFQFTKPLRSLRSGRIHGEDWELLALDSPWSGFLLPPSRAYTTRLGLQTATWRDPNVITPAPAPAALVARLENAGLVHRHL